jgi:flagellar basal body P-ring protein FlgI
MSEKNIDNSPRIVLAKPDIETVKRARRWLRGAAMLLADASNGSEMIDRIAREASTLALMAEVAVLEYSEDPDPHQPSA